MLPYASPEIEVLLLCARPKITPQAATRARELIQARLDWPRLLERAVSWGLLPLFSRGLGLIGTQTIHRTVRDHIQSLNSAAAHRNLLLTGDLLSLLDLLADHCIPVIPYKGPVLAQSIYGNLALRPFGDLDIIIRKRDVHRARDLLLSRGYQLTWPQIPLTDPQDAAHLDAKYNYKFERPAHQVVLELHWGISPKYFSIPSDPAWLWQRLEQVSIGGKSVPTFSPEDYLLVLCIHGANHCWLYHLVWVCDIAELLHRNPELNWDYMLAQASALGAQRILLLGLLLAHDLLGIELPSEVWGVAKADETARSLADKSVHHFTQPDGGELAAFYIPRYQLNVRERFRDKLRYALFMSAPSVKDWNAFSLPAPFAFIYYLLRPIRLLIEHGWTPMRHRLRSLVNELLITGH